MHSSIRKINAVTGIISTASSSGDFPQGVAVDASGNIFISGEGTDSILKADAATGEVTDIGGNDQSPTLGDGGLAANARIDDPEGLALDKNGNLYVASDLEHRIRKIAGVAAH